MSEFVHLQAAINALEGQRSVLGDAVVDAALVPLRARLAELQPAAAVEQRRVVTVLFSDLVGFTAMSSTMDPEDVREIVNAYFTRWTTSIEKWGGVVEKFIGDAVMAVFGLAQAQEDDPERAVHAALEMCAALEELNASLQSRWGVRLAMRVGIHTGPVMVSFLGERKGQDFVAVGDTVNLASRIQNAAPPGGVLLTHDTYRHVRGVFDIRALDPVMVKGKPGPISVYLALRAKRHAFRTPSRGVEGLETPLVGRSGELSALQAAFETTVREGSPRLMTVFGDAGVGKTRLIAEFENWLELLPQFIGYFKGRAAPSMQNLPYSLLRDLFSFRFEILDSDTPAIVQTKFEQGFSSPQPSTPGPSQTGPQLPIPDSHLVAAWLGFPLEHSPALPAARQDASLFHDRALAALLGFFHQAASTRPIVILLEDLHWADDSSLDALEALASGLPRLPLLIVCTARPTVFDRRPTWGECERLGEVTCSRLDLQPLSTQDSSRLIDELLRKCSSIPESLHERITGSAEGNPFFIEELVNMLIAEGVIQTGDEEWQVDLSRLTEAGIPSTLAGVLQARFDSLTPDGQALLQCASVLGRVFWDAALTTMANTPGPEVQSILEALANRAMIYPNRGSTFEGTREYLFKHALVRDVTYGGVLKRLRRVFHAHAAAWLEEVTGRSGRSDEWSALIADHWDHAGDAENARLWYHRAGLYAADHYANAEGIRCFNRCLELWPSDDPAGRFDLLVQLLRIYDTVADRESQRRDVETLQVLATQLEASREPYAGRAWSAEAALQRWHYHDAIGELEASERAAEHAMELAEHYGALELEARATLLAGATAWRRSDWSIAQARLERALSLARQAGGRKIEADSLRNLGIVSQYQGDRAAARLYYSQALSIYAELEEERGQSMLLNSLGILAQEGRRWDEALQYFERSLELKRKIGHQRAIHITLQNLAVLNLSLGRFDDTRRLINQVLQFSLEDSDLEAQADSHFYLGEMDLRIGHLSSAHTHLETALAIYREIGSPMGESQALISIGKLSLFEGDPTTALAHAEAARNVAEDSDLAKELADTQSLSAEAHLALGDLPSARAAYTQAVESFSAQDNYPGLLTSLGGLARTHLAAGDLSSALTVTDEILARLTAGAASPDNASAVTVATGGASPTTPSPQPLDLSGLDAPFDLLHICLTVLRHARDPRAPLLHAHARSLLLEWAARLESDDDRSRYLSLPHHQEILAH